MCTRPDIAFSVGVLSRFSEVSGESHWKAVKRTIRYPIATIDFKLKVGGTDFKLIANVDSDFAGDVADRKCTSDYVFKVRSGSVVWSSKKQGCVSLSTTETEMIALALCIQEAIWLKQLLEGVGVTLINLTVNEDNQSCLALTKNYQYHSRTQHIDIRYYFVRQQVEKKNVF